MAYFDGSASWVNDTANYMELRYQQYDISTPWKLNDDNGLYTLHTELLGWSHARYCRAADPAAAGH